MQKLGQNLCTSKQLPCCYAYATNKLFQHLKALFFHCCLHVLFSFNTFGKHLNITIYINYEALKVNTFAMLQSCLGNFFVKMQQKRLIKFYVHGKLQFCVLKSWYATYKQTMKDITYFVSNLIKQLQIGLLSWFRDLFYDYFPFCATKQVNSCWNTDIAIFYHFKLDQKFANRWNHTPKWYKVRFQN